MSGVRGYLMTLWILDYDFKALHPPPSVIHISIDPSTCITGRCLNAFVAQYMLWHPTSQKEILCASQYLKPAFIWCHSCVMSVASLCFVSKMCYVRIQSLCGVTAVLSLCLAFVQCPRSVMSVLRLFDSLVVLCTDSLSSD